MVRLRHRAALNEHPARADRAGPGRAARAARAALRPDGTLMLVETMAGDRVQANLHAVGRGFYGAGGAGGRICRTGTPAEGAAGPGATAAYLRRLGER